MPKLRQLLYLSLLLVAGPLAAQVERNPGVIAVTVENDLLADTDRNYTNGLRIAGALEAFPLPDFVANRSRWLGRNLLPSNPEQDSMSLEFAIGHSIFTPEDRLATRLLPDQHPYAGWLYLESSVFVETESVLDTLSLQLGVVGPAAGGEFVQNNWHDIIEVDRLRGWSNQLQNEPGLALHFDRRVRLRSISGRGLGVDLIPNVGLSLGNVLTQGHVGATARFGTDLGASWGPPRVRPALGGISTYERNRTVTWHLFAGAQGRIVGRNLFLDGNTFRDSTSVRKRRLVADLQAGLVVHVGRYQLSYTWVHRTEEFTTQGDAQRFAAFSLVRRFR